jgi:hypothetical protein
MSRPLRSTATPASSGFPATTGRSASERRIGTQCLRFLPRHAPSRDPGCNPTPPYRRSPSHVPCKSRRPGSRRLYAGHHLARNAGTRQAHLGRKTRPPDFDAISNPFDASTAHAHQTKSNQALLERLPGPHLTRSQPRLLPDRSPRQSSANATSGRFSARPRRADAGGPTSLHLSHSTAYIKALYMAPPSAFVTHGLDDLA